MQLLPPLSLLPPLHPRAFPFPPHPLAAARATALAHVLPLRRWIGTPAPTTPNLLLLLLLPPPLAAALVHASALALLPRLQHPLRLPITT